ncbi:MAG: hypothetical protein JWM57_1025 [Phycisphaerales bacterium]|nr:hypothetical protein [Phycisphaerales bacterium]
MKPGEPANRSLAGRAGVPLFLLLIVATVAQTMSHLVPELMRDDLYGGDAQQHVWWLYKFVNPKLYPNDPIAAYYSLPAYSPPGYQFLMRGLAHMMDLQHAAEWLAIVLTFLSIGLTAYLGLKLGKKTGAMAALAVFVVCRCDRLVEGGFPRSFGLVFLLLGLIALNRRWWAVLGLVFAASPLFYAPTVLNLAPATAIVLAIGVYRYRRLPHGFAALFALGCVGILLIAMIYLKPLPDSVGKWYTYAEAKKMPEWKPKGRTAFFRSWETLYFSSPVSGIGLTPKQTLIAAAVLLAAVAWRPRVIPMAGWGLLVGALATFVLAHLLLFKLYLPSRYTSYAFPVFAMVACAGYARELKMLLLAGRNRLGTLIQPAIGIAAVLFCGAVFFASVKNVSAALALPAYGTNITPAAEPVLVFLRTLPVDALIAAHPDDANIIPLRTQHSVLTNTETSVAFNKAYYDRMRDRLNASFDLLYATDWATIDSIADKQGVSVFVVDQRRLTNPDDRPYWIPFRTTNLAKIDAGKAAGFAMLAPPADRILFRHGDWLVLRVGGGKS